MNETVTGSFKAVGGLFSGSSSAPLLSPAQKKVMAVVEKGITAAELRGDQAVVDKLKELALAFITHGDWHPLKAFIDVTFASTEIGPGDEISPDAAAAFAAVEAEHAADAARAAAAKGGTTHVGGIDIDHSKDFRGGDGGPKVGNIASTESGDDVSNIG